MKKILSLFLSVCLSISFLAFTAAGAVGTADVTVPHDNVVAVSQSDIDNLTPRVDELVARVEATSPTGTMDEQRRIYLTLKKEIDVLESEIDLLEDKHELDYLTGSLSWQDYRTLERELDALERKLDKAEDYLKDAFRRVR